LCIYESVSFLLSVVPGAVSWGCGPRIFSFFNFGKTFMGSGRKSMPAGPGRPKGCKNKFPIALKDKVIHACEVLEAEGKDLATCALADPVWFWETFVKPMLPKEVLVSGDPDNPLTLLLQRIDGKGLPNPGQ
jgi:hypothetical protein